ncbi:hypothetical protein LMG29542_08409 [Paraburkholderia humisilvae]|uniref:Uncharacterized protein n=1 Tax=Paraburkholderia humisilvae TaxID=627669 RepID=A0A6J5FC47_9BURK|nr:hypothetical protein LMG29542_08409 [Paraburkholderia humisilvae]
MHETMDIHDAHERYELHEPFDVLKVRRPWCKSA